MKRNDGLSGNSAGRPTQDIPHLCSLFHGQNTGLSEVDTAISKCSFWVYWCPASSTETELLKVAAAMDLGWTLLEMDAPLLPPKYNGITRNSNPYMVVDIAGEIGSIRHMPTKAVFVAIHRNTRCFFSLVRQ